MAVVSWFSFWFLSKARLGSGDVTPLLDNGLLDLPWVGAGPGADLLGDVNALLGRLKQGHQLGDMLALLLGLQVAGLLWDFGDNSLGPWEALLWAGLQLAAGWAAELLGDLLTLGLGRVLLDPLLLRLTDLLGPLGTLLLGGVTLSDILALLLLDSLALNHVIFDVVLVVPGLALGLVDGPAFDWARAITDEGSVAELNLLLRGNLPVVDEAVLDEVLLALLLLLGLEVGGVGGVALLGVAMLALNDVIVLGLLDHHDLVDTSLAGGSDGSNVQGDIIATSLTGSTGWGQVDLGGVGVLVVVVVLMSGVGGSTPAGLVEWESSPQVLATTVPPWSGSVGASSQQQGEAKTAKTVHGISDEPAGTKLVKIAR